LYSNVTERSPSSVTTVSVSAPPSAQIVAADDRRKPVELCPGGRLGQGIRFRGAQLLLDPYGGGLAAFQREDGLTPGDVQPRGAVGRRRAEPERRRPLDGRHVTGAGGAVARTHRQRQRHDRRQNGPTSRTRFSPRLRHGYLRPPRPLGLRPGRVSILRRRERAENPGAASRHFPGVA
jgi:hypothetical protein